MNLPEFTENVNVHQSLSDQPTLTPTELKIKWDEGVSKIKSYINDVLLPALNNELPGELEAIRTEILNEVNRLLETLESEISKDINTTNGNVSTNTKNISTNTKSISTINNSISSINNSIKTINNNISGLDTRVGTVESKTNNVSNLATVLPTFASGVNEIWSLVEKKNGLVSFFIKANGYWQKGVRKKFATLPSGYRPVSQRFCLAMFSNGDFDRGAMCEINTSGELWITPDSVDMTDVMIQGVFNI